MNLRLGRIGLCAAWFGLASVGGAAAQSLGQSSSGLARASVIRPISLSEVKGLEFGVITPGVKTGSVTIGPADAVQVSDTSINASGVHSAGVFQITGQSGRAFSVSTAHTAQLSGAGGARLTVSNLVVSVNGANGTAVGQLDSNGAAQFRVGGTLSVQPAQAPGRYVGSYPVSVAYQ